MHPADVYVVTSPPPEHEPANVAYIFVSPTSELVQEGPTVAEYNTGPEQAASAKNCAVTVTVEGLGAGLGPGVGDDVDDGKDWKYELSAGKLTVPSPRKASHAVP